MFEGLAALLDLTEAGLAGFILVFARVGAVMALLPGFGERMIPARVRLGARHRLHPGGLADARARRSPPRSGAAVPR